MKSIYILTISTLLLFGCKTPINKETIKKDIIDVESSFQQMTIEKGIAEAFYFFADENAVIKRENDTLIIGKEEIKMYYQNQNLTNVKVDWKPDFVDVSESGDLAYTYGKYVWEIPDEKGAPRQIKGIFHTVWKKQKNGTWKYVWD